MTPPTRTRRPAVLRPPEGVNLAGVDTGRHTISATKISRFLGCHRKYDFHHRQRLELIARPRSFTLGTAYQKAIEYQDPLVGVRYLNGFSPCDTCEQSYVKDKPEDVAPEDGGHFERTGLDSSIFLGWPCPDCAGRGYTGEQQHFWTPEDEAQHRINEAIVEGASALYLREFPTPIGEKREFEFKVPLRNPRTGAYSLTYDLLGYADGVIDPLAAPAFRAEIAMADARGDLRFGGAGFGALGADSVEELLDNARAWERGEDPEGAPFEVVENKLVDRLMPVSVKRLPLDRQLALIRYGVWRATKRPIGRVHYRFMLKPSIKQRGGRKKDKSDAETLDQFCDRIRQDYIDRPEFYCRPQEPVMPDTDADMLRIEADLWEWAAQLRDLERRGHFDRNTSHCTDFGGCPYLPICTGDPDAMGLYRVRPPRKPEPQPNQEDQ